MCLQCATFNFPPASDIPYSVSTRLSSVPPRLFVQAVDQRLRYGQHDIADVEER
ncbi:MAG: hypothetical protein RMJ54_15180 [Roseiflexaceae bacterium]|nr:hypothetical protein [Roseiflexus sp.]MDW8146339.1 hypothetical protein [Roseiflexaceae bacterium]MDW8234123.1 hypothetical protein [Roseiflexaceae bacterium]